jgi:2-C-methyl-D-erythritol 4-phosphate cytidylyltransferase
MVVCVDGWEEYVQTSARQFGITKLRWVVTGGATSQESIRNGIFHLEDHCQADDVVVIHDGIRPLIEDEVLSDVIVTCRKRGNAVTSMPYNEQIFVADDEESTTKYIPRDALRRVATPQAYRFGLLDQRYHEAFERGIGIGESSYTNTMMADLGERLFFAMGSEWNIKLTTREDLEMFKAYLRMKRA